MGKSELEKLEQELNAILETHNKPTKSNWVPYNQFVKQKEQDSITRQLEKDLRREIRLEKKNKKIKKNKSRMVVEEKPVVKPVVKKEIKKDPFLEELERDLKRIKIEERRIRREKRARKYEKEKKKKNKSLLPRFVKRTLLDKVKFFTKYDYEYENINTEEEFYNAIKDALRGFPDATSVSIHIRNKESGNKFRSISIRTQLFDTYQEFKDELDRIIQGNFVGSDAVNLVDDEIIYNHFALAEARIANQKGHGVSDKMIFEVCGIEESSRTIRGKAIGNRDCAKQCLLKLVKDRDVLDDLEKTPLKDISSLDGLKSFLQKWDLNINIVCNSFLLKRGVREIVESGEKKRIPVKDKKTGMEFKYISGLINLERDVEVVYKRQVNGAQSTIIFDEFNQHYDIIKDNRMKLCDDVYITLSGWVIKKDIVLFTPRQLNINSNSNIATETRYLIFDYETIIDFKKSSCMQEYSLSILNLTNDELEELTTADENKNIEVVNKIRKDKCITFLGYDCSKKFIEWVLKNQTNTAFVLIGFNNTNFDNFILLDSLLRYKDEVQDFSVSDIFYNGSQLLNFYMCGRHNTFDIHKHLMGSLKNNCESFKINCCAKKSFDHNKAQQLYLDGKLIDWITDNEELKEYNEYDVLATAVLFCKYRRALGEIKATEKYSKQLHNIKTIGSLIYKVFEDSKTNKKFDLPKINYQQYKDLQKCKIAGRVELFNGVQKVEERLASTDVCSLYPYVMSVAPVYYPCGKVVDTNKYMGADVIGFYYCDIDQRNLKSLNLPKIYCKKSEIENNWDHNEVLENYLISNVMIELLKKFNCGVVIKNGFYFTEKMKSCEMFDFLLDLMKAKNEEDTKKKNKDNAYNPALRETLKLLMNSLSGKVIEGLHSEKTQDVNSVAEYEKIKEKSKSINFINTIGNKIFITYELDEETLISKQRPIYLGVLIYDYAKSYMYNYSYSKVGLDQLLYTDTDASKFRYSKFLEWKRDIDDNDIRVPHWEEVEKVDERYKTHRIYESNSKVFGSFEDELEDMVGTDYKFYCVEKKSWCYAVDGKAKFRFKGLNGSALLLNLGEEFIEKRTIKHKSKDGDDGWEEVKYGIASDKEIEVYNYAQDNKNLAIEGGNELKFFEQIYSTGEAYLLCSSFRKIVKNSAHNVSLGEDDRYNNLMNKVQVNYMMKHINLYKKK